MSSDDGDRQLHDKITEVWNKISINEKQVKPEVDNRPGWKTVRVFVSSTFKDFHQEREILVKKVFADLRAWCEQRELILIDCDLRWGVPKETTSEITVRTCLEEIDRCYADNKVPYFVNLTCRRIGWIPSDTVLPKILWDKYEMVSGLSVTEMEIVHAAYRIENPNALFLIRDDSFLNEIEDEEIKKEFIDEKQPVADTKLSVLKDKITSRFFGERVVTYKCKYVPGERLYSDYMTKKGRPKLELDEEQFSKTVLEFFKKRIDEQYPVVKREVDEYLEATYHHEAFMKSRCEVMLGEGKTSETSPGDVFVGREDVLKKITDYIDDENDTSGYPRLIVGEAGAGKSSIMAKAASTVLERMRKTAQPCKVFFHFVGAVPDSTSLLKILRRLLKEMQPNEDFPETLEETEQLVRSELSNNRSGRIIIFIDALNQVDKGLQTEQMLWFPEKLAPNVRCILSLISDSEPHRELMKRKEFQIKDAEILIPDLETSKRLTIVNNYLILFGKKLEMDQAGLLLDKKASSNPLWLRIACEELRIYGDFRTVTQFIISLEDSLLGLLKQVFQRFEKESDRVLLISTLCLLEASRFGLREAELLEILADKENLEYRETSSDSSPEGSQVRDMIPHLPYAEWVGVYRNLRIFLRPYGNPSEGRLDFYHRSLSKVVQEMYLESASESDYNKRLWWWHKKLADFFRKSGTYDRKVEEYPYHLLFLKRNAKNKEDETLYCKWLQQFLLNMGTFERLFNDEFSDTLLFYWRESGDENYEQMCEGYEKEIRELQKCLTDNPESITTKFRDISRLMCQAGKYKDGLRLAEECLDMVEKFPSQFEKETLDEKLMYLYGDIAHFKLLMLPPTQSAKEIPELEAIIDLHSRAIKIINESEKKNEKKYQKYLALQLTKVAYARGGIASRCDAFSLTNLFTGKKTKKEMTDKGIKEVKEAISLYEKLKDYGHELDAQLKMATLYRGNKEEQLRIYKETRQRCRRIFGKEHHLMCRLCFNTGIVYEDAKETENAYKYFRKAFDIGLKVFGPKHQMTQTYRNTLKESKYAAIGKKKGHTVE